MSIPTSISRAKALEAKAAALEQGLAGKGSSNAALSAAIESAELYMQALKITDSSTDRRRLDKKCKDLLVKAESIKASQDGKPKAATDFPGDMKQPVSTRTLSTREKIIILEGSKLNGFVFKPWTEPPTGAEFELRTDQDLFLDSPHLKLSAVQQQSFAGWRRPKEALPLLEVKQDGIVLSSDPTMVRAGRIDLVQDLTSDCSVVASLCAGTARAERGHPRILGSILCPYDYAQDQIMLSPNGKYVLRFYFNGCWRRVEIDDLLPTSKTSRVMHVVDRTHPGLLWPALVEKAYLKVRGGYEFPGSNSGTDLAVLTGWIPQQVFLHDEDTDPNDLWDELYEAFEAGNMLLTIGTGKLPRREQKQLGLAAEHDYAVLELKVTNDVREMLIKNPWSDGDVWIGASKRRQNPSHIENEEGSSSIDDTSMMPGTFWMDFNSVFHYYENMYINWNPGLFLHRQDLHFSWLLEHSEMAANLVMNNPQFCVRSSASGEIWLLLNRHFRTGDYTTANSGKNGYISLYLYNGDGMRILSSEGASTRGPFVDSPNTLVRLTASADAAYTVVVMSQDLPLGKHNFTLSVLSKASAALTESSPKYQNQSELAAAWTYDTAWGNSGFVRYLENPQFSFSILSDNTKVAVVLQALSGSSRNANEVNVHLKLVAVYGRTKGRITKLRPRDVIATSGDYRRGNAIIESILPKGEYVIICSTFEEKQLAKFQLGLYSNSTPQLSSAPTLSPIPAESSTRFSIITAPAAIPDGITKVAAQVHSPRSARVIFIARPGTGQSSTGSLYKLSVQLGYGPYAKTVASSADDDTSSEFSDLAHGLRIEEVDLAPLILSPEPGGIWLVLERPGGQSSTVKQKSPQVTPELEIEILADEKIDIGNWCLVDE